MNINEMIKIMQHYENDGEVENKEKHSDDAKWILARPVWNWDSFDYRIKEPEQNVTIEKWLMQSTIDKEYRIVETSLVDTVVNFKKVKLIKSYEVEL